MVWVNKHVCLMGLSYRQPPKMSTTFPEPSQFIYNRVKIGFFVHKIFKNPSAVPPLTAEGNYVNI